MSKLIIGCKKCFEEIKNRKGYLVNNKGLIRIPIVVHTAYSAKDLYELFFEGYTCPFCQQEMSISSNVMEFATHFIDKKCHIVFNSNSIELINQHQKLEINLEMDIEEIKRELSLFNNDDNFLSSDETEVILNVVNDIDLSQWDLYIQSSNIAPYYKKYQYK